MQGSAVLIALVAALLLASRHPAAARVFRWLPVPLWCYGMPMALRAAGWLPADGSGYAWIPAWVLPVALALLLLSVDLPSVFKVSLAALRAMFVGALAIVLGGPVLLALLKTQLPQDAWQGIGILAATWTGGSLNMVAVQAMLDTPEAVFAPLVIVDALVAYGWMACLIAAKGHERRINRWLGAAPEVPGTSMGKVPGILPQEVPGTSLWLGTLIAVGLTLACRGLAQVLPLGMLMASRTGWTILLVTTLALACSCVPAIRRTGQAGAAVGYPCLYLVLSALGAQASLATLLMAPSWLVLGLGWLAIHAASLIIAGRLWHMPLGVLATASQANVGGLVSAPLVGAVYHQRLAAVGLVLAVAGNAIGTYLGLAAALLARWLS